MIDQLVDYFHQYMGQGYQCEQVPDEIRAKYAGHFMTDKDKGDTLVRLWNDDGFCGYQNGLFWLVNPDRYTPIARKFPDVTPSSVAFARSATGGLFLYDTPAIGDSISYLNVHTGDNRIVSTGFQVFIAFDMPADTFWKRECYGKIELKAVKRYGPLDHDECVAFVPALALGGSEKVANMQKVKIEPHLEMLAQLHAG